MTVVINSVTTADAVPTSTPHKISNQTGKQTATVRFTPNYSGTLYPQDELFPDANLLPGEPNIRAYRFRDGGSDHTTGTLVSEKGKICGTDVLCGTGQLVDTYTAPDDVQILEDITYAETGGGADGARTINVYVLYADGTWE